MCSVQRPILTLLHIWIVYYFSFYKYQTFNFLSYNCSTLFFFYKNNFLRTWASFFVQLKNNPKQWASNLRSRENPKVHTKFKKVTKTGLDLFILYKEFSRVVFQILPDLFLFLSGWILKIRPYLKKNKNKLRTKNNWTSMFEIN